MSILSILDEISSDPSKNAKEALIYRERNNNLLVKVFSATYNTMITYGIKKIPEYRSGPARITLDIGIDFLSKLSSRELTGHAAINALTNVLEHLSSDDAEVLSRIVSRDLRMGCSASTINKIHPGLIPTFDVLLCNSDTSGINYPAFGQLKGDGMRCHLFYDGAHAYAVSRNGKPILVGDHFDSIAKNKMKPGETWDGELICYRDGKLLDRKTGNGIINKAIKDTITKTEIEMIHFMVWDIVDFTSTIKYKARFNELSSRFQLDEMLSSDLQLFLLCPTEIVNDEAEALSFYKRMRAMKFEGAVIKNFDLLWEGKRVKGAGKMKAVEEADLKIVGIIEGEGKYVGMLGAFSCETSDGVIRVNVGSGFSDKQRKEFFDASYIGKICAVEYNEKIHDKKTGEWSLFLPRFVEVRVDKDFANSFDELK